MKLEASEGFAVKSHHQYLDFGKTFRQDNQFSDLIYELVADFAERNAAPWLSPLDYWHRHQEGDQDHNHELRRMASLELFLRTR